MNNQTKKLVSIGMPTYNRAALLPLAFDALLNQTYKNIELIISDDGSTDETERVCREYATRDSRVSYIRQPKNIGRVSNFTFVLAEARGDYFMWAGDDDRWDPHFIEKLVDALGQNPKHQLAMSSYQRIFTDGEVYDSVVFSGAAELVRLSNFSLYRKMMQREAIHHAMYGIWQKAFLEKLLSRPVPESINGDRIFMSEVGLSTCIASIPEILFFKDKNRVPIKKRSKNQMLGHAYHAPFAYSRYLWHLLWRPLTSSVVPVHRKFILPFLWLETLWFERDRILWDFVRTLRRQFS